uniref:hypothetical protein n=1 Tax=Acinetobacter sp. YH12129 TaxID=2601114 RepID=UPI0015D2BAE0
TTWGAVADIDRLEEITRFNPDLLPTLQAISDFASYDVTQHLKSKTVKYGVPTSSQDNRFNIPVYDVARAPSFAITDDFLKNYTKYCENVLNAVTAHYSAKETDFNESFSLNTPKHALPWLIEQNTLSDSRMNEILEPISAFSLRQKNEVFSAQLEQIEKQQSHIAKAFEQAQAHVIKTSEVTQTPRNQPSRDNQNRFDY